MTMPSTDFSIFDGQELVEYAPAAGSPIAEVRAVRRPLTQSRQRNVETFVALEATDVVFHLEAAPLAGIDAAAGDTLTDGASQGYEVLFIERQTLDNTFVAVGRPT